jgi:hypothetical protein
MMELREERRSSRRISFGCMMMSVVAGIDLGDSESMVTVLSPTGDATDRFSFPMDCDGYSLFAGRVPRNARVTFEAAGWPTQSTEH